MTKDRSGKEMQKRGVAQGPESSSGDEEPQDSCVRGARALSRLIEEARSTVKASTEDPRVLFKRLNMPEVELMMLMDFYPLREGMIALVSSPEGKMPARLACFFEIEDSEGGKDLRRTTSLAGIQEGTGEEILSDMDSCLNDAIRPCVAVGFFGGFRGGLREDCSNDLCIAGFAKSNEAQLLFVRVEDEVFPIRPAGEELNDILEFILNQSTEGDWRLECDFLFDELLDMLEALSRSAGRRLEILPPPNSSDARELRHAIVGKMGEFAQSRIEAYLEECRHLTTRLADTTDSIMNGEAGAALSTWHAEDKAAEVKRQLASANKRHIKELEAHKREAEGFKNRAARQEDQIKQLKAQLSELQKGRPQAPTAGMSQAPSAAEGVTSKPLRKQMAELFGLGNRV